MYQPVRSVGAAFGKRRVLQQDARSRPLDINIDTQEALRHRLKIASRDFPEHAGFPTRLRLGKAQAHIPEALRRLRVTGAHYFQNQLIQQLPGCFIVSPRIDRQIRDRLNPAEFEYPQISGMDAISPDQALNITVLRKQGNGGYRPVCQDTFEILRQGETCEFNFGRCVLAALLRALDKPLHCRFHGTQNQRRCAQTHHLKRAHGLMQLLTRNTQLAGIQRGKVGTSCQFSIPDKALQGLGRAIQRLAQFVQYPGQRAQIIDSQVKFSGC
ncbi:MAG: hypothetical protein V4711_12470 [Pseudomonadota bacterium]